MNDKKREALVVQAVADDVRERIGRDKERAAVVAWLREQGHAWANAEVVMLADFIERGEHRREEEEP